MIRVAQGEPQGQGPGSIVLPVEWDDCAAMVTPLRGYGNAINAAQAEEFIRAYLDILSAGAAT